MKKVLIMSDSHGLTDEIEEIKTRHQLTNMIHCGDSELAAEDPLLADMISVKGNCDFGAGFKNDHKVIINQMTFFVTHGHLYDVKATLLPLSYRAAEDDAKVVCFGHTHIAGAEKINDQLFINPGSIRLPRNRREKTYAILSFNTNDYVTVDFFTVSGKRIEDLTYQTSLR